MARNRQAEPPHCPIHMAVKMIAMKPEIQRGYQFGKYAQFKTKVIEELRRSPRWQCPVAGCHRVHVDDDSISESN